MGTNQVEHLLFDTILLAQPSPAQPSPVQPSPAQSGRVKMSKIKERKKTHFETEANGLSETT